MNASSSPTIDPHRRYLSVVLEVPPDVDAAIRLWRGQHGPAALAPPHITVFIAEHAEPDAPGVSERVPALERVCRGFSAAEVTLEGADTFHPISDVAFLCVSDGADWLRSIHEACAEQLPSASPFEYHPHLTLVQNLGEAVLRDAEQHFSDFERTFPATHLGIYCGNLAGWDLLGTVDLLGDQDA